MPRFWKLTVIRPVAIMPVMKYWVNLTPPPIVPWKIDAKIRIMMMGKPIVKTTDSRLRRNWVISSRPWRRASAPALGRRPWLAVTGVAGFVVVVIARVRSS